MLLPVTPTVRRYSWVTSCLLTLQPISHWKQTRGFGWARAWLSERYHKTHKRPTNTATQQKTWWTCAALTFYLPGFALLSPGHGRSSPCRAVRLAGPLERQRSGLVLRGFSTSSLLGRLLLRRGAPNSYRRNPHDSPAIGYLFLASRANGGLPVAKSVWLVTVLFSGSRSVPSPLTFTC